MTFPIDLLLPWLDVIGLTVFAASGALAAARKRLDFVGACFFALITATGGGTLRDLLIGAPIFWMQGPVPVMLCVIVAVAAWAVPLRWWPRRLRLPRVARPERRRLRRARPLGNRRHPPAVPAAVAVDEGAVVVVAAA